MSSSASTCCCTRANDSGGNGGAARNSSASRSNSSFAGSVGQSFCNGSFMSSPVECHRFLQEITQFLEGAMNAHADVAHCQTDNFGDFLIAESEEKLQRDELLVFLCQSCKR